MKLLRLPIVLILSTFIFCTGCFDTSTKKKSNDAQDAEGDEKLVSKSFDVAMAQYDEMLTTLEKDARFPKSVDDEGQLTLEPIKGWTSGFFPGSLWMIYEYSDDDKWKAAAEKWTHFLEPLQDYSGDHDIGFRMFNSYGNGLRLTGNSAYDSVLIRSAQSLCKRFNPNVAAIKSWDKAKSWDGKTEWYYPVIIDNMMNLELLFYAFKKTGNPKFEEVALTHANTTIKDFYRPDYSSYHVVNYDSIAGKILDKATAQGYADNSAWSRGQAWGLYGFTVMYRETKDKKYLDHACQIAKYIMGHTNLPEDLVPYWDYHVHEEGYQPDWNYRPEDYPDIPRDASAAAITASALYELSTYTDKNKSISYIGFADELLQSLSSDDYLAEVGKNNNFILKHSVGSIPHGAEIDKPLIYADYYFLEALLRKQKLMQNKSLVQSLAH
ncbi:glucuronyl hydrolase [Maribacter sp. 2210JD10-5]|uniref:glucuronyl hydrolase n=1 Tax=Maribacter sp. 2210JD10-5 TaxID=3386272 RepID=UPI0039BC568E